MTCHIYLTLLGSIMFVQRESGYWLPHRQPSPDWEFSAANHFLPPLSLSELELLSGLLPADAEVYHCTLLTLRQI